MIDAKIRSLCKAKGCGKEQGSGAETEKAVWS